MSINVAIMQDASEIIRYDHINIPIYIRKGCLSLYPQHKALCHWHDDLELILIDQGSMYYDVNGARILLEAGDCLLVNSRQMHYGYGDQSKDCLFLCLLIQPSLLAGNQGMYEAYFKGILENADLPFWHIRQGMEPFTYVSSVLNQLWELKQQEAFGYELQVLSLLQRFWYDLIHSGLATATVKKETSELHIQRDMITYIYKNYAEAIALEDIALAGNVCRSHCCALFKKYLQQSPIDFLNHYRLEVSCHLLHTTALPIIKVANACGFNHSSYYAKLFYRQYACTPLQYRKSNKDFR